MKEKWGESLAANFSFGVITLIVFAVLVLPLIALIAWGYGLLGIIIWMVVFFSLSIILSAAKMIFVAAVYEHINNAPVTGFDEQMLDSVFVKEKKGIF